jgi:hypothetical protein
MATDQIPNAAPLRIFLSYRREDTAGYAGRLYDALVARFPADQVFIDIDTIEPGVDFVEVVENAVGACDVFITLIGQRWAEVMSERAQRGDGDESDFVRLETEAALKRKIRVIPVLVQGAKMPRASELPESLAPLTRRNALELSDHRWRYDVEQLIQLLERLPPPGPGVTPTTAVAASPGAPAVGVLPTYGGGDRPPAGQNSDPPEGGDHMASGPPSSPRPRRLKWKWWAVGPAAAVVAVVVVVLLVLFLPSSGPRHGGPGSPTSRPGATRSSLPSSTKVPSLSRANWTKTLLAFGPADLTAVSCASTSFCVVGDEDGTVFSFNGNQWSGPHLVDRSPANRPPLVHTSLNALSCPSRSFCAGADELGDVVTYNGRTWSAPTKVARPHALYAISCVSSSFCVAVSGTGDAFSFNGRTWSAATPLGTSSINAVSCPTSSFCMAVAGNGVAYIFNGSTWSSAEAPDVGADVGASLNGVSCPTSTFCAAVDVTGAWTTFNGKTWSQPEQVNLPAIGPGDLFGVSCPHPSYCVAVGEEGDAQSFDGANLSKPAPFNDLSVYGVSCPSSTFCVAIQGKGPKTGEYGTGDTALVWRPAR